MIGKELLSLLLSVLIVDLIVDNTNFCSFSRVLLSIYCLTGDISRALFDSSHHNNIYFMDQRTNVETFLVIKYDILLMELGTWK